MGQGVSSQMGKNCFIPFWISIVIKCLVEYCFFWLKKSFFGIARHHCAFDHVVSYHKMVLYSQQSSSNAAYTLFTLGMFCHRP